MTDAEAQTRASKTPHLDAKYFAFYAGRNAAACGGKNEFTDPALIQEWKAGYRQVKAEDRIDADTEWDAE